MRIISGKYKGRIFNNKLPKGIRPTQDAMRETIFNILNNYIEFDGKIVADICAGAGMLGIEALSRNAKFAYFVDKSYKSIEFISNNLNMLRIESENYKTVNLDALQFVNHINKQNFPPLDLIFLDPPYNTNIVNEVIIFLNESKILNKNGIIIAESAIHSAIITPDNFEKLTERNFGASKITLFVNE
jgi:16S rRNA (guanine(966)-N(2))-methyltransferase RsmD